MKIVLLSALIFVIAWEPVASMGWRGSPEPEVTRVVDLPYDSGKEEVFEGTLLRIDPSPCMALPTDSYHILMQIQGEVVEVHLAPCWYAWEKKPALKVGDTLQGAGVELSRRSGLRRVIAAREIRQGKDVLRFRDLTGEGLWKK